MKCKGPTLSGAGATVALALALMAGGVRAEPPPGEAGKPVGLDAMTRDQREDLRRADERLEAARQLASSGKPTEAAAAFQRLIEQAGDELVPVDERHYRPARWACHRGLAALPAAALQAYRDRIDARARRWLADGLRERDGRSLERVVAEAFCSRPAETALVLLGDRAFERGDYAAALHDWQMLTPTALQVEEKAPPTAGELCYPKPQGDLAAVRARQVLALLYLGERDRARKELASFRKMHGRAEGRLAGRTGNLADTLEEAVRQPPSDLGRDVGSVDTPAWNTFAGRPERNHRVAADSLPLYWPERPERAVPLPGEVARPPAALGDILPRIRDGLGKPDPEPHPPPSAAARRLAFHPLVWGDFILLADAWRVFAIDRRTGRSIDLYHLSREDNADLLASLDLRLPAKPDLRYTLTAADGCVYARLGAQVVRPPQTDDPKKTRARAEAETASFLVCLGPPRDGREPAEGPALTLHWQLTPTLRDTELPTVKERELPAVFEGTPVVRDGQFYVAVTRFEGQRGITSVRCYAAPPGGQPVPRWQQDVCESTPAAGDPPRLRHELLTRAGANVVFATQTGLVVALDAATGKRVWAAGYPRRAERGENVSPRALAPCVYADGRLFVAPDDADRIVCLDAATGALRWESTAVEVVHLLGVAGGALVATTGSFPPGIRALDAASGAVRWSQPDDGPNGVPTYGRGFLTGRHVFWPTARGLHVLSVSDGEVVQRVGADEKWGNLVYADKCLVAATDREVKWFVAESGQLPARRREVQLAPADPVARYRLASAEADAGMTAAARADFRKTEELADADGPLRQRARRGRFELLLDKATEEAAAPEFPPAWRAQALARLARERQDAGRPDDAVAAWQHILDSEELRAAWLRPTVGAPISAGTLALDGLERLKAKGAATLREAARTRAEQAEKAGRPAEAIDAYRALLQALPDAGPPAARPERALALARLAHWYERAGHVAAARTALHALGREFGAATVPAVAKDEPVREVVARGLARLAERAERHNLLDSARPDLGTPVRVATLPLGRHEWPLADDTPAIEAAGDDALALFGTPDGSLTARSVRTGKVVWSNRLPHAVVWSATYADTHVVAGPHGASRVRTADGHVLWTFAVPAADPWPFRALHPPPPPSLSAFRFADGRWFCLLGGRRLLAIDAETGRVAWQYAVPPWNVLDREGRLAWDLSYAAPGRPRPGPDDTIGPNYLATAAGVLLQTAGGSRVVLDSATGRRLSAVETGRVPWPAVPLPLDGGRRAVVCDGTLYVTLVDLATGRAVWRHTLDRAISLTGEPAQVVGADAAVFLVVARNEGYELDRLDSTTGKRSWAEPAFLGFERPDLTAAAADARALYLPDGRRVRALDLLDGRELWDRPLPNGPDGGPAAWHVGWTRYQEHLLIAPNEALPERDLARVRRWAGREFLAVPSPGRTHRILASVYDAWMQRRWTALLADPKTGAIRQRLDLPSWGPRVILRPAGRCLLVATDGTLNLLQGPPRESR